MKMGYPTGYVAGFKLVATGLRQCLSRPEGSPEAALSEQALERLFMSLA
jgi:hypothetical protein